MRDKVRSDMGRLFDEFGPDQKPVIWAKLLACDNPTRRPLDADAVFSGRNATGVPVPPLTNLGVTLDAVAEHRHAFSQLRD